MIGVEVPNPGSFTFHFTCSVSLQLVGGAASGATPDVSGPRHCGQLRSIFAGTSAAGSTPAVAHAKRKSRAGRRGFISGRTETARSRFEKLFPALDRQPRA